MTEREELEQEIKKLRQRLGKIESDLNEAFTAENKPLFEKKYNDTYWLYKNSYSCNSKKWNIYVHAKKVESVWDCGYNGINAYII